MRCFSSLGLLGYPGIKARLTAPPGLSQSSTPFSLLAPRHPPHALTSLAALFAPSLRVATHRDHEHYQLASFPTRWESRSDRRCCLSLLRLVSCRWPRTTSSARPHRCDPTRLLG